jgi:hypothetical protein
MLSRVKTYLPEGFTVAHISWAPRTVHEGPNREKGRPLSQLACRPAPGNLPEISSTPDLVAVMAQLYIGNCARLCGVHVAPPEVDLDSHM